MIVWMSRTNWRITITITTVAPSGMADLIGPSGIGTAVGVTWFSRYDSVAASIPFQIRT
jgi:hypothetical protein